MNTLTKWNPFQISRLDPFREIEDMEQRLGSLFERTPFGRTRAESLVQGKLWPAVDISETDKDYVFKADLPDVARSDVKVSFQDGVLEISGERKEEKEETGRRFHRTERSYGSFLRSFTLPVGAEGEKAKADFHNGVLCVKIPKSEKTAAKTVEVKIS
jgi:HSP20 family protein